jgi:hypothetical protein
MRTAEQNGTTYVSVTSAMRLVKRILNEPEDCYGPAALAKVHMAEGEACHRACLDWLAFSKGWLPSFTPPPYDPLVHPNKQRWTNVLCVAVQAFQEWIERARVEPIGIEQEAFSKTYGLVGHVDLVCWVGDGKARRKLVVDLKFTSSVLESHRLQVRCYNRLDGLQDAAQGLIWQCDRNTGRWTTETIGLTQNLDDVMAVSHAAHLWAWQQRKRNEGR